jgi:hypothetical protein
MIEWNIFYKMLGIPEDITEPTYYDLLGLHPKTCSAELVDRMLHKQKSRLRQNIPGPQFIPLVLKFEKEKLERAAEVLRDPQIREKYNKYLRQKAHIRKREKQKGIAKQRLLNHARDIVNSLLGPDKTLDDSRRPILIARLKDLGINESRINSLLERIPRPAEAAAKSGDEAMEYFTAAVDLAIGGNLLTPDAELKIIELAKKLNIDKAQAINKIDQTLKERNAQRGESDVSLLKSEFENRVLTMVPNGLATQDQYRLLLALARADNVPDIIAREVLNRCLKIVTTSGSIHEEKYLDPTGNVCEEEPAGSLVSDDESEEIEQVPKITKGSLLRRNLLPIALITIAIGIFIVSASLFMIGQGKDSSPPKSPDQETVSSQTQSPARTEPSTPAPNTNTGRQGYIPEESEPTTNMQSQGRNPRDPSLKTEHQNLLPPKQSPQNRDTLKITAADVRNIYSPSTRKNKLLADPNTMKELLADLALTMRLCYHRATYFSSGSTISYSESFGLSGLLEMSKSMDRVDALAGQVNLIPMPPVTPLTDSDSFAASERKSAEELLGSIKDRTNKIRRSRTLSDQQMTQKMIPIYRDLYQLSKLPDPDIPQSLRKMINEKNPLEVNRAIALTIDRLCGSTSPPASISRSRQSTSRRSTRGTSKRITPPPTNTHEEPAWEPDPTIIKLLAITTHYAGLTAKQLTEHQSDVGTSTIQRRQFTKRSEISCSSLEIGQNCLNSLDTIVAQLSIFIKRRPGTQYAENADKVTESLRARKFDCKTVMQTTASNFKAIGDLLALLIQQSELGDEINKDLEKIRLEREQLPSRIDNVVHELRESCYYNLRLWDILVDHNINATTVSQEDGRPLLNNLDSSASQELTKPLEQEDRQQREALNELRKGLNAYINGHYTAAVEELNKARQSQYVVILANSVLLSSLEDIFTKCVKAKRPMSTCKKCDGTGLDACNECLGSGVKFCPKCKGYALIQKIAGGSFFCDICRGAGYIQECNGSDCDMGFKRCQCIKKVDVSSHEKQAIEELIAKANYLYSGGIDYFTTEALEPSSKIQPLKPKTKE